MTADFLQTPTTSLNTALCERITVLPEPLMHGSASRELEQKQEQQRALMNAPRTKSAFRVELEQSLPGRSLTFALSALETRPTKQMLSKSLRYHIEARCGCWGFGFPSPDSRLCSPGAQAYGTDARFGAPGSCRFPGQQKEGCMRARTSQGTGASFKS